MKILKFRIAVILFGASLTSFAQQSDSLKSHSDATFIFPDSSGWNIIQENQVLSFKVRTTDPR
ncbi:MAG TPA: hypothetical protein VFI14_11250, partial [Chryseosolibacter sp.]|nr:hypothetical protein [Chryseosolibacter sp.]